MLTRQIHRDHAQSVAPAIRRALALALLTSGTIPGFAAQAQGQAGPATPAREIEEVVVSVTRLVENIQEVPVAVNVFSEEAITNLRIETIEDVLRYTPGAEFGGGSPDQTTIGIRGISSDLYGASQDASVVTMVDNTVLSRSWMRTGQMFDIERVEVARGPQGTSFGRNATGGVVHFVTRRPQFAQEHSVGIDYGSYDYTKITAIFNPELSDTTALRLGAYYQARDGYYEDQITGESIDNTDTVALRAQLLMQPSETLEILLRGNYAEDHWDNSNPSALRFSDLPVIYVAPNPPVGFTYQDTNDGDVFTVGSNKDTYFDRTLWDMGVELAFEMGNLTLNSITNFRHGDVDTIRDPWGTNRLPFRQKSIEDADVFQQELRLDNSAAEARLTWLTGLYYLYEDTLRQEEKQIMVGAATQTYQQFQQLNTTNSFGIFGTVTFDLTPTTELSAGLRYSYDEKDYSVPFHSCGAVANFNSDPALVGPQQGLPGAICTAFIPTYNSGPLRKFSGSNSEDWDDVSYRLAVRQSLFSEALNVYLSYATGYKSGGFSNEPASPDPINFEPFDPETVDTLELGAKFYGPQGISLDIAAYDSTYDDIQVEVGDSQTGQRILFNGSGAKIQGVEAQITWQVTDSFSMAANGNYIDARYDDPGLYTPAGDLITSGPFTGIPSWTGFLAGNYTFGLPGGSSLTLHGDVRVQDEVPEYLSIAGNPLDDTYDPSPRDPVYGANIAWQSATGRLGLTVWGRNLSDELNPNLGGPTVLDRTHRFYPGRFQGTQTAAAPLTYGVSFNYSFQ
jgi:iron complex outermembrane recepter protein